MAWTCGSYFDYLFDRRPHWDEEILKDWFPYDDAWIGQVATGVWEAGTGDTHYYDRIHVGAPDLSQAWQTFTVNEGSGNSAANAGCGAGLCNPTEISVAWGSTRKYYGRERQAYTTNVLCFDQINTRAKAREQFTQIVDGLRKITKMVQSDYLRSRATMTQNVLYIAGSAGAQLTLSPALFTGQMLTLDVTATGVPTSLLTMPYLQRFYEPLQLNGYFKSKYVPEGTFKLITDIITSQQLTSGNPALAEKWKFSDFATGGTMYKYGMTTGVGNFGIVHDKFPARFYPTANPTVLRRVWPYYNTATTIGVEPLVDPRYITAPIQISHIWHAEAMRRLVPNLKSVSDVMPFLTRDLAGKWEFVGGNRDRTIVVKDPATGTTCTIDNSRGNQGRLFADFENSIKMEYPEWTAAILHLREPGAVFDAPACSTAPTYVVRDYSDVNPVC